MTCKNFVGNKMIPFAIGISKQLIDSKNTMKYEA